MTALPPITISPQAVATAIAQIKGLNPGDPRDAMMLDFYTKALFTEHGAHLPEFFLDGKIDATEAQYINLVTDTSLSKADPFSSLEAYNVLIGSDPQYAAMYQQKFMLENPVLMQGGGGGGMLQLGGPMLGFGEIPGFGGPGSQPPMMNFGMDTYGMGNYGMGNYGMGNNMYGYGDHIPIPGQTPPGQLPPPGGRQLPPPGGGQLPPPGGGQLPPPGGRQLPPPGGGQLPPPGGRQLPPPGGGQLPPPGGGQLPPPGMQQPNPFGGGGGSPFGGGMIMNPNTPQGKLQFDLLKLQMQNYTQMVKMQTEYQQGVANYYKSITDSYNSAAKGAMDLMSAGLKGVNDIGSQISAMRKSLPKVTVSAGGGGGGMGG